MHVTVRGSGGARLATHVARLPMRERTMHGHAVSVLTFSPQRPNRAAVAAEFETGSEEAAVIEAEAV